MNNVQYGATEVAKVTDEHGSTETIKENIRDWSTISPIRRVYEIRRKVTNQNEELEEYSLFSNDTLSDTTKLDISFRVDRHGFETRGYYYITKCYTQLQY